MFNRDCRPNLLAIIVAQKAQSIQRSVTEAQTNFLYTVSLQRKKHAPLLPMSAGLAVNKSRQELKNAATQSRTPLHSKIAIQRVH